jgi:hypothetical protein
LERFGLDTAEVENVCVFDLSERRSWIDSGLTAVGTKSVDSLLQQGDLSLVISVMLEQAPDQSPDGNSGILGWIALVHDPANHVVWVEVINRALQIFLGSGEIILCPAPRGFASTGFGTRPILRW